MTPSHIETTNIRKKIQHHHAKRECINLFFFNYTIQLFRAESQITPAIRPNISREKRSKRTRFSRPASGRAARAFGHRNSKMPKNARDTNAANTVRTTKINAQIAILFTKIGPFFYICIVEAAFSHSLKYSVKNFPKISTGRRLDHLPPSILVTDNNSGESGKCKESDSPSA